MEIHFFCDNWILFYNLFVILKGCLNKIEIAFFYKFWFLFVLIYVSKHCLIVKCNRFLYTCLFFYCKLFKFIVYLIIFAECYLTRCNIIWSYIWWFVVILATNLKNGTAFVKNVNKINPLLFYFHYSTKLCH